MRRSNRNMMRVIYGDGCFDDYYHDDSGLAAVRIAAAANDAIML